jgi:hypothetical protein
VPLCGYKANFVENRNLKMSTTRPWGKFVLPLHAVMSQILRKLCENRLWSLYNSATNSVFVPLCDYEANFMKDGNLKMSTTRPWGWFVLPLCAVMSQILYKVCENSLSSVHNTATNSVFVPLCGYEANFMKDINLKVFTTQLACHYSWPCCDLHEYLSTDSPCLIECLYFQILFSKPYTKFILPFKFVTLPMKFRQVVQLNQNWFLSH